MRFRQALLSIAQKTYALAPDKANSFPELYVDFQLDTERGGQQWTVFLHPKQNLTVQRLELQFDLKLDPAARFFANGWQSASESRCYFPHEAIPLQAGEPEADIPRGPGYLHSWTYCTVEGGGSRVEGLPPSTLFMGSLNERTGFTLFLYDHHNGILTVRKDMDGLPLAHSFPALDFWVAEGEKKRVLEAWFGAMEMRKPHAAPLAGWSSGAIAPDQISEELLTQKLDSLVHSAFFPEKENSGVEFPSLETKPVFLLEDGWPTVAGDWLSVRKTFPKGLSNLASKIRSAGCLPALRIAPFVAAVDSELARLHPDWLLKTPAGKPLKLINHQSPQYALDFYHPKVQEYLTGVFHMALEKWGFELLKLDLLYAACLAPPAGKTRGQIMHEAMEWLRLQLGDHRMLAAGVPLGPAFGLADYGAVAADLVVRKESRLLAWLFRRRRAAALAAVLRNVLSRWPLNGLAFGNATAVLPLEKGNWSALQQHTVMILNALLGNLLLVTGELKNASLQTALALQGSTVQSVAETAPDCWRIDFQEKHSEAPRTAFCNLTPQPHAFSTKNGRVFAQPFETILV